MRSLLLVLLVLATFGFQSRARLAAGNAGAAGNAAAGEQAVELVFSHQYHVAEEGLECADCHAAAETSRTGLDNLMPTHETCSDCHDVEDEATCATCHADPENPRVGPRIVDYSRPFSHERHAAADLACEACHAAAGASERVEPFRHLPAMIACQDCHEARRVDDAYACETCHTAGERLTPLSHAGDFRHAHGLLARTQAETQAGDKTCQTCHRDDFCQECHEGDDLDRFNHPLNYAFTHALDAQAADQNCVTCHTDRQFCADCHRDNLVLPHTHTAGWTNRLDGGRHRFEAMSDLESCLSCHEADAERVCQPCHGGSTF